MGKYSSEAFPIDNGLKQGCILSPFIFNFVLEYATRRLRETTLIQDLRIEKHGDCEVIADCGASPSCICDLISAALGRDIKLFSETLMSLINPGTSFTGLLRKAPSSPQTVTRVW
jgi:hypothetical protein